MKRALLITALAACAGRYTTHTPATVPAPPDAFAKATRVLIERGESIETKDESAGLIVTKWEDSKFMGSDRRMRWSITVANGSVTVASQCHSKLSGDPAPGQANEWGDCGNQPGDRNEKARAIADAIAK